MKKLLTAGVATALFLLGAGSALAATTLVHPGDMGDWGFLVETGTGAGALVNGPDTPPLGTGSANLTTADGAGGVVIGKLGYEGLAFADIDSLAYSTYVDPGYGGAAQTIALQFNADDDVTDGDISWKGRLVFEPYYTETVTKGVWQTWDPKTQGKWWGTGAAISAHCSIGSPCTWDELLTALPDVGVNGDFGGVLFKAGSGWPAPFDGNVDAFSIVSAAEGIDETYDFEGVHPASGSILEPEVDEIVYGEIDLVAVYDDGDDVNDDAVQWAVREGTCASGSGALFGNVAGNNDPYNWDGKNFDAVIDTSGLTPGKYCFVFNPTDDAGQDDVRETREFYVAESHINGGGRIQEKDGKRKDWKDISFGGWVADIGTLVGEWQVNVHNVSDDALDKGKFHTNEITALTMFASDSATCDAAMNFTASGSWNGEDGYTMTFRGGDNDDTVRITINNPDSSVLLETSAGLGGDFSNESSCVGTARTGLDAGNLTIVDNS